VRQQLRLRVLAPVAILGLLGVGYGAFAYGTPEAPPPLPPATTQPAEAPAPTPKKPVKKPAVKKPHLSPLQRALRSSRVVVVVFYAPQSSVDSEAVQEARAGALAAGAGFLSVNVSKEAEVANLAQRYAVREAPAILVFVRGPRVVSQFDLVDRETVAQAVVNARG
jgi:hypothetical protein